MAIITFLVYGVIFIIIILILLALSFGKDKAHSEPNSFYSMKEVLEKLEVNEGALKNMVAEGMLRSYRKKDQMVFKKEDINELDKKTS